MLKTICLIAMVQKLANEDKKDTAIFTAKF